MSEAFEFLTSEDLTELADEMNRLQHTTSFVHGAVGVSGKERWVMVGRGADGDLVVQVIK